MSRPDSTRSLSSSLPFSIARRSRASCCGRTYSPRSLPFSRNVKISFGCPLPSAHSLHPLRVQGLCVAVSEPFATGNRAANAANASASET